MTAHSPNRAWTAALAADAAPSPAAASTDGEAELAGWLFVCSLRDVCCLSERAYKFGRPSMSDARKSRACDATSRLAKLTGPAKVSKAQRKPWHVPYDARHGTCREHNLQRKAQAAAQAHPKCPPAPRQGIPLPVPVGVGVCVCVGGGGYSERSLA